MRVKFQDVECFRDYQYEYSDYEEQGTNKEFTVWKPPTLDDIKKEEEMPKPVEVAPAMSDYYTEMFAEELGLRSLKNQSSSTDVEKLDLSFLYYDAADELDSNTNITLNFSSTTKETKSKSETSLPKPNALNEILFSNLKKLDGVNLKAVNLLNQSIKNTTSSFDTSSNDNVTLNSSVPAVVSNLDNVTETENTTLHNDKASLMVGNASTEMTNLNVTLPGNLSSILEADRMNETLSVDNQTSVGTNSVEESEERLIRGDVFIPSVPLSPSSTDNLNSTKEGNVNSLSNSTKKEDVNDTATNHVNMSTDGTNHSMSIPMADIREVNGSRLDGRNVTIFELEVESTGNTTSVNDTPITAAELEYGHQMNSSEIVISSLENVTHSLHKTVSLENVTVNISTSNSSGEISSESWENVTALLGQLNRTSSVESFSNETMVSGNLSLSNHPVKKSSSEELSASDSSEEVFIYLKENNTEVIKTTSIKTQGHNWTYEVTHHTVPKDIPDHMLKYLGKEAPKPKRKPKIRKVNHRQRPQKGQGMKTRKRKEYKPQVRSGLLLSPRGFNPVMTPRGSRPSPQQPFSDEEELINMPVVIGVPRPDFSDYELYVPGEEPDHLALDGQDVNANEYEYVSYKDPYSSHEDIKDFNLDDTTKYYLEFSGSNFKTYFISAEEAEWDYAGYGQR